MTVRSTLRLTVALSRLARVRAWQLSHPAEILSQPVVGFQVTSVHFTVTFPLNGTDRRQAWSAGESPENAADDNATKPRFRG